MGRASGRAGGPRGGPGGAWTLPAAWIVVNGMLVLPWWLAGGTLGTSWIALEATLLVGVAALLPAARWSRWLARAGALAVGGAGVLLLADAATRQSLGRPLNLYLDVHLAPSVLHLLQGSLGPVTGTATLLAAVVASAGLILLAAWLLGRLPGTLTLRPGPGPGPGKRWARAARAGAAGIVLLAVVGCGGALAGLPVPFFGLGQGWTERPAVVVVDQQLQSLTRMLQARDRFEEELADTPGSYAGRPGLLDGLGGEDVVLAFVESYGTTVLDDPRYAAVVRPRLEAMGRRLQAAGLHVASGRMISPSQGGQSWLAHGSVLSGLWIEDQLRYDLLLASERETLVDDFRHAGYHTVAVMPAITMAWPEGTRFRYDRIWARKDIDYRGPALNWVTMPDQYTWAFFQREIRDGTDAPLFAELGLISSHAPWTPVLPVLEDWDAVGDGSVFERWADAGETPEALWRDPERVREHFGRSVAYAVDTGLAWAERYLTGGGLLILMGDHQPAPLVTGEGAPLTVPVHVVSADPSLIEPFRAWGFAPGPLPPDDEGAGRRMDAFRSWFVTAFSGTPEADEGSEGS